MPASSSTAWIDASEGICTHADSTSASAGQVELAPVFPQVGRVEAGDGEVVGHLEGQGVDDLDAGVFEVVDDQLGERLQVRGDDRDLPGPERGDARQQRPGAGHDRRVGSLGAQRGGDGVLGGAVVAVFRDEPEAALRLLREVLGEF
jgi:hypothetical protein